MIGVRATNDCGLSNPTFFNVYVTNCGSWLFRVFPNPTSDVINIESQIKNETAITEFNEMTSSDELKYELYDFYGKSLKSEYIKNLHTSINVSAFRNGIYILKIISKDNTETHRIVIN